MSADYYSIDPMKETEQTLLDQIKDPQEKRCKACEIERSDEQVKQMPEHTCKKGSPMDIAQPKSAPSESQEDFAISFAKFCQVDLKGRTFNDLMSEFKDHP